ncbi:MAG TPA: BadF/BadG/BcrA/BcrD ATPase family protein [Gemmatimonadaceae bacterium]|nr:BadF/BadG/BcrA/BcrD ATPase family protein [Gemmatimonadaceae bacterium]
MTAESIVLGLDGGGTKTRLVVADGNGHVLTSVSGGPSAIGAAGIDASADTIMNLVSEGLQAAGLTDVTASVMCAGIAGAGREERRTSMRRALRSRELADEVIVTTDAEVALADAFGHDGAGVLLIAGTGSVAFARSPTGTTDRCGGWGPALGDEGSAYWLGLRALSAATASADGREPDSALLGALMTATQCDEPEDMIAWAETAERDAVANLAPIVMRCAENGDRRASTITTMAAEELVLHIRTLARRLFVDERAAVPVALSGGLLARGSLLRKLVEHRLKSAVPGAQVKHDEIDGARGALKLAMRGLRVALQLVIAVLGIALTDTTASAQGGRGGRGGAAAYVSVSAPVVALTHARVIDGTGAPAKTDQTVIIQNGMITALGPTANTSVPAGAQTIDATGQSLIPGLVMVHEHLYYPNTGGWYGLYDESFTRLYLAGGVTSMRTGGNVNGYTDIAIKQQIDRGQKAGPWIDATAPYLQGPGGAAGQMYLLKDAADARKHVNFWADAGATSFKAYMNITRDELRAAIEEAHKRGLKLTGHLCSVTYREAAEMGIDNLEHSFFVATDFVSDKQPDVCPGQGPGMQTIAALDTSSAQYKSLVSFLVQKKVALTSTLTVFETFTPGRPAPPGLDVLEPNLRASFDSNYARTARNTGSMYAQLYPKVAAMEVSFVRAGGMLVVGTDPTGGGGVIPGYSNQRAIELLVEAGLSPLEAIKASTLNGATYLDRADKVGSIAVGKQADLVLLAGDPSTNIADVRKVEVVFKNGVGYDPKRLIESVKGRVGIF